MFLLSLLLPLPPGMWRMSSLFVLVFKRALVEQGLFIVKHLLNIITLLPYGIQGKLRQLANKTKDKGKLITEDKGKDKLITGDNGKDKLITGEKERQKLITGDKGKEKWNARFKDKEK